jgi:hypothetical protein
MARKEVLRIFEALDLRSEMDDAGRVKHLTRFLCRRVLPCFEMYQTKEAVRRMMGNWGATLRANSFGDLPNDWWPKE